MTAVLLYYYTKFFLILSLTGLKCLLSFNALMGRERERRVLNVDRQTVLTTSVQNGLINMLVNEES